MQRIAVEESRLGIPLLIGRDVIHGFRTVLPIPLGLAATFNPELVRRGARMAALEAAAAGVNWTFAPMIDISRDPRWGRVAESFGEDPPGRDYGTTNIPENELRNVYLPPFKSNADLQTEFSMVEPTSAGSLEEAPRS